MYWHIFVPEKCSLGEHDGLTAHQGFQQTKRLVEGERGKQPYDLNSRVNVVNVDSNSPIQILSNNGGFKKNETKPALQYSNQTGYRSYCRQDLCIGKRASVAFTPLRWSCCEIDRHGDAVIGQKLGERGLKAKLSDTTLSTRNRFWQWTARNP